MNNITTFDELFVYIKSLDTSIKKEFLRKLEGEK